MLFCNDTSICAQVFTSYVLSTLEEPSQSYPLWISVEPPEFKPIIFPSREIHFKIFLQIEAETLDLNMDFYDIF